MIHTRKLLSFIAISLTTIPWGIVNSTEEMSKETKQCLESYKLGEWPVVLKTCEMAASQGVAYAHVLLGTLYADGEGVPRNDHKAFNLFHKGALGGSRTGEFQLGYFYETGRGVLQNSDEAIKWLTRAAKRKMPEAQDLLGVIYGKNKDYIKAYAWASCAEKQGVDRARKFKSYLHSAVLRGENKEKAEAMALEYLYQYTDYRPSM